MPTSQFLAPLLDFFTVTKVVKYCHIFSFEKTIQRNDVEMQIDSMFATPLHKALHSRRLPPLPPAAVFLESQGRRSDAFPLRSRRGLHSKEGTVPRKNQKLQSKEGEKMAKDSYQSSYSVVRCCFQLFHSFVSEELRLCMASTLHPPSFSLSLSPWPWYKVSRPFFLSLPREALSLFPKAGARAAPPQPRIEGGG